MGNITRKDFLKSVAGGAATLMSNSAWSASGGVDSTPAGSATDLLLVDATVVTMDRQRTVFGPGYVWIRSGLIHGVGSMADLPDVPGTVARRSLNGQLIMPGLVNCHTHLSNSIFRGIYDEMPLETWFGKGMWPVLDAMNRMTARVGTELALLELMTMGVTTVVGGEFGTPRPDVLEGVLPVVRKSGVRAIVSRMTIDSSDDSSVAQFIPEAFREKPSAAVDRLRQLQQAFNSSRISVVPEALGVLRCTEEMILAMHELAVDTTSHFLMHAASSQDERDESRRRFGHGSIMELDRLGVLGPNTLLAHAVWLDNDEIGVVADRKTGVSHNPVANAYYASGLAPLFTYLDRGVRVGFGTDGASTNNSQNVWETMKMAMLFQKQGLQRADLGSAELALELMTLGGARALNRENQIGSLEPGKFADLIVIDTHRVRLSPPQTVISNLVYSNDPGAVRDVYVQGELVVRNGVHQRLDAATVIGQASEALNVVLVKTGLDEYLEKRTGWSWR